jgi:hypothetical protein
MLAPADPVADFIAALLAIIDGLCRALAEQAGDGAGLVLRARGLTKLRARLRRMGEELAKETAGAEAAEAPAEASPRAAPRHPRRRPRAGRRAPPRQRSGPAPRPVHDTRPRSPPAVRRLGGP